MEAIVHWNSEERYIQDECSNTKAVVGSSESQRKKKYLVDSIQKKVKLDELAEVG
jgi:hypothetical protein